MVALRYDSAAPRDKQRRMQRSLRACCDIARLGPIVRRCSSASRSFVLATLRALHLDPSNASDKNAGQEDNDDLVRFGPTRWYPL